MQQRSPILAKCEAIEKTMRVVNPPDSQEPLTVRNRGGRPGKLYPTEGTLQLVEGCAAIMASVEEAAAILKVDKKTFIKFKASHAAVREAWENGRERGKVSLRRKQFALAATNGAVALRLGELYLEDQKPDDQQSNQVVEVTVKMAISSPGGGALIFDADADRKRDAALQRAIEPGGPVIDGELATEEEANPQGHD